MKPPRRRHLHPDDRDYMAPFGLVLQSGDDSWRQTAKPDRSPYICTRSIEAIEDQLLHSAGSSLLPNTNPILHTQA